MISIGYIYSRVVILRLSWFLESLDDHVLYKVRLCLYQWFDNMFYIQIKIGQLIFSSRWGSCRRLTFRWLHIFRRFPCIRVLCTECSSVTTAYYWYTYLKHSSIDSPREFKHFNLALSHLNMAISNSVCAFQVHCGRVECGYWRRRYQTLTSRAAKGELTIMGRRGSGYPLALLRWMSKHGNTRNQFTGVPPSGV